MDETFKDIPDVSAGNDNSYLLLIQADFYIIGNELEKALINCNIVLTRQPEHPAAFYYRGIANQGLGNFEAAQKDFEQCISIDSDFEEALSALHELNKVLEKQKRVTIS